MKKLILSVTNYVLFFIVAIIIVTGCSRPSHFIYDKKYRIKVENAFEAKKAFFMADTLLFSVFTGDMTTSEREAMKFLYAYMPIGDIADYNSDFYLRNVRASFEAQEEMPWGKDIPEMIFRHFVLPVRVNNENLDESRMVFYKELKERVKGLSLYDAVLEVNHWCHEKVVYTPSDVRTSSPLASVRSAYGRCGEESTFTVAALRSVGIPARQVYTPRWAHTDDNHAWVEAWVDGKWCFMGACEPEPVLNLGWFNAPAYRSMIMHTKVFGDYDGPEEVMERTECYTEINVIENYAPAAKSTVKIVDASGSPVEGALVEFKLYNYAEFFSVARKMTDSNGNCSLSAGKGDMLIWASKDGLFGFSKLSFGKDDNMTIILDKTQGSSEIFEFDIVPPIEGSIPVIVSDEQKKENERRLREEDIIRNKYVATFYSDENVGETVKKYRFVGKESFIKSRGNHAQIEKYLINAPDSLSMHHSAVLLNVVSDKDLRDTPAEVFLDHLIYTPPIASNLIGVDENPPPVKGVPPYSKYLYDEYLLNPRIANELLTPYKKDFSAFVDENTTKEVQNNPEYLVEWVNDNIKVRDDLNPQSIPIMPGGVLRARIADTHSRNIFFVAAARSLGIPARIEPVAKKVQYFNNKWIDANFDNTGRASVNKGYIISDYKPVKSLDNPQYYSHFTIAKILPDGTLQTLDFETESQVDMGDGNTWKGLLQRPLALDEGSYILITGTRMASGKVLARTAFFTVEAGKTTTVELVMRESSDEMQVIGSIDAEAKYHKADSGEEISILNTTGRGYFIIGILGARQEPTNHAMRDIAKLKSDFEKWNRSIVLLFKNEQALKQFDNNEFGGLPSTITYGIDTSGAITNMISDAMKLIDTDSLPVFIIADTFGRVVFFSQGYTIGLGEQMMKVINKL